MAKVPVNLFLLIIVLFIFFSFASSIVKNVTHGQRKTAAMKILAVAAVIFGGIILLNYSISTRLSVPMGSKYESKYVIDYDKVITSSSGTKVKLNKVFLDMKYVSLTVGVKGKDKLVAVELKKNPDDKEPLHKLQGQWIGSRWSYKYNSYGIPYKEDSIVDPIYVVCYLSNGEEMTFEIRDIKDIKSKTEFIRVNKVIEHDGRKLTIESVTRAINFTNISAKSEGRFGEMEVSIINNGVESEKSTGGWSGGGSTYNYDFSFKRIEEGNITIKIRMISSGKEYFVEVK